MKQADYTVLIADDEANIRNGLMEAIPWANYNARVVGTATNGQEALSMVLALEPDLAVLDIKMPLLDGLEVIRQAREKHARTRFIILSGYDDFVLAQKAIRYGACAYFLKPLKIEEFKDELASQMREIAKQKRNSDSDATFEMLLSSSRVFLLNQLIQNELRSQEEIERRSALVGLGWLRGHYRVLTCSAAGADAGACQEARTALHQTLADAEHEAWLHGGEMLVCIVGGDNERFAQLKPRLIRLLAELKGRTGRRFYAGVGKTVQGAESMAMAYTSSLRALSYHIYERAEELYDDSMICRQEPPFTPGNISCEALVSALELADKDAIWQFCRQYLEKLFFVPMPPPDFLRGMSVHLVSTARIQFLARHPDVAPMMPVQMEELRHCHSVKELCMWMTRRLMLLADHYQASRDTEDPIIREAKAFIRDHIDANLKARDVAAHVNLSESYFTVFFKQKTGENFRDYLLRVRIDLARSLLAEGRLSVGEIAAATGYQDYRSFSRAFKNITGFSPSEYHNP